MKTFYKHGCWNAVCDECGFIFKSDELKRRWDGFMVCDKDFEVRNPLDFIKAPKENPSTPWQRPDPTPVYTSVTYRPFNSNGDVTPP